MMAGLFDTFSVDPMAAAEAQAAALRKQQEQNLRDRLGAGKTGIDRAASDFGASFGSALAKGIFGEPEDKDLENVRDAAKLAASISEIEGDPTTSDFAAKAAEVAEKAGRKDLAIKYREAAGLRAKAEAKALAETQAAKTEESRKQFSALPTAAQEELVAVKPDFLVTTLGVDPAEAAAISKNVAERNQFQKAKLQKQLSDVSAATTTKTTNADVNQIKATLSMFGISEASFGFGDNAEEFDNFATPIAAEVQRRMDVAKDKGERLDRNKVTDEVFKELETSGAIVLRDRWFGEGKVIEDIDTAKFKNVFTGGATGPVIDLTQ